MDDLKAVFEAVAQRRRRLVLQCLAEHPTLTLADLAEEVAEREATKRVDELSAEHVAAIYFTLYHKHVPALESSSLVRYDQANDVVSAADGSERIIDRARAELERLVPDDRTDRSTGPG